MAFSRRLGVIGILGVCWFVAVGCNDDEDQKDSSSDGGEGGEAPSAGKSSVAGSANNAGKSGAGTAGKGGTGGTATAGTGGETPVAGGAAGSDAGNGGAAGTPEVSGGAGGVAGADAGGAGGVGGDPGVPAAKACSNECEIDGDCVIGTDETLKCNQANHRCEDPLACSTGADCVPGINAWDFFPPCTTSADCDPDFQRCTAWQGQGYCAYLELDGCLLPGEVATSLPEFGNDNNQVTVCVVPAVCTEAKQCEPGCEAGECGDGAGDTCDTVTHLCKCTLGSECTSNVCGADGVCQECVTAADCEGAGLDECVNGKCGCSAANVCPDLTTAGTPVCE